MTRRRILLSLLALAALVAAGSAFAQDTSGTMDFQEAVRKQIAHVQQRLEFGKDLPVRRQRVLLTWLIELYEITGNERGIEACYRRIIDFIPYDVVTLNNYAAFLLERGRVGEAERCTSAARRYHEYANAPDTDRGRTFELDARVALASGDTTAAVRAAERAVDVTGERVPGPLRALAESYTLAGRYDDAVATYLALIALERGRNANDINAAQVILERAPAYDASNFNAAVTEAIESHDAERIAEIEAQGAEVVRVKTGDGVVLEGTLRRSNGSTAALFVHAPGSTRDVYTVPEQLLFVEGVTTLSVDLRGHGGSRSDSLSGYAALSGHHVAMFPADILACFRRLEELTGLADTHITIVSAGSACALVEKAIHEGGIAPSVVHLSPMFDRNDRDLVNALSFHPDRPFLVIVSTEDLRAQRSLAFLLQTKEREHLKTRRLTDAGHGPDTLKDPETLAYFVDWVAARAGAP